MILSLTLVSLACGLFLIGGFIVGVRRALDARDALRVELTEAHAAQGYARSDATRLEVELRAARLEAQSLRERAARAEADAEALRSQRQRADTHTQGELERLAAAEVELREKVRDERQALEHILAPLFEKDRIAHEIQRIDVGRGTRVELPRLLDHIARVGGLSALVLSDDSGLPLAASEASERAEVLAGVWSQLLIVADRVVENGDPAPVAVRVLDVDGRALVHRIFSAGEQRFLLTGVARAGGLGPESLEPAVAKIERVLMRDAWGDQARDP